MLLYCVISKQHCLHTHTHTQSLPLTLYTPMMNIPVIALGDISHIGWLLNGRGFSRAGTFSSANFSVTVTLHQEWRFEVFAVHKASSSHHGWNGVKAIVKIEYRSLCGNTTIHWCLADTSANKLCLEWPKLIVDLTAELRLQLYIEHKQSLLHHLTNEVCHSQLILRHEEHCTLPWQLFINNTMYKIHHSLAVLARRHHSLWLLDVITRCAC